MKTKVIFGLLVEENALFEIHTILSTFDYLHYKI